MQGKVRKKLKEKGKLTERKRKERGRKGSNAQKRLVKWKNRQNDIKLTFLVEANKEGYKITNKEIQLDYG